MAVDPDEFASLREKFRRWVDRQAERERKRKWLIGVAAGVIWLVFLYWLIRLFVQRRS